MSIPRLVAVGLLLASILAAWLRFDAGLPVIAWLVVLSSLAGAVGGWLANARRLPPLNLPAVVVELGDREELTATEEARFATGLRSWHERQQLEAWREIAREGPAAQIVRWATLLYLWLSLFAIVVVPPAVVSDSLQPELPRFVVVLAPLAAVAVALAAVLGQRDRRRIRQALGPTVISNDP